MDLSALDETLMHQAALPFELAATSDHRFYDRHLVSACAPDGKFAISVGMGVYKNMNVLDGFVGFQAGGAEQHNLRLSRALRPRLSMDVGPLRIEILKPLESLRFILDAGEIHPFRFDLVFTAQHVPHLEEPHSGRVDGRLATDYLRYCQNGRLDGSLGFRDAEYRAENWYAWRDHSWGVRGNVGGFDPYTGTKGGAFSSIIRTAGKGMLTFGFGFRTAELGGYITRLENGDGEILHFGGDLFLHDGTRLRTTEASSDIEFFEDSRNFSKMTVCFKTEDGRDWEAVNTPVTKPWIFKGLGYDGGYSDGKGHGVYRAQDLLTEYDVYDVRDQAFAVLPDGSKALSRHREQPCTMVLNGVVGNSYIPLVLAGPHRRYPFA